MSRKRLCIIGFGRMGKQAVNAFADQFQVEVISSRDISSELVDVGVRQSSNNTESLSGADVIFLAIPVWALGKWVSKINEHAKSDCVVIDCCTARLAAKIGNYQYSNREGLPREVSIASWHQAIYPYLEKRIPRYQHA